MKLGGLILILFSLGACGGESFVAAAVSVSPDSSALGDAQQDDAPPGRDDGRVDGVTPESGTSGETEAAARDVRADPWPDDVEVQPMPDGPPADARPPVDALVCHNPPCRGEAPCLNCFYVGPGALPGGLSWGCCPNGGTSPGGKCLTFELDKEYGYCGNCGC